MRFFINLPPEAGELFGWLIKKDSLPSTVPIFPNTEDMGLVVASLISGAVLAEVLPAPEQVTAALGKGIPLGRLYFQIPKNLLYSVCPGLTPEVYGGK